MDWYDDDENDDRDIMDRVPEPTEEQLDRALGVFETIGGVGHIDLAAEEARLREREEKRVRQGARILDAIPGREYTEDEADRLLYATGVFRGFRRDMETAMMLKIIRRLRERYGLPVP